MAKDKKVKVLIRGGMGNQMFQVAYAKTLANKYGMELEFINFSSNARVQRNWSLSCFGIQPASISRFAQAILVVEVWLAQKLAKILPGFGFRVLVETKEFVGPSKIKFVPNIISGYWQGEKYFLSCQDEIKKIFTFPSLLEKYQLALSKNVDIKYVAIHIRRGDYVSDPIAKNNHLVCDPDWYEAAWRLMRTKLGLCQALVFSDDIEWVRNNVFLDGDVVYVDNLPEIPDWIDMARMTNCDHFIISNSTYSWWAAWLGKTEDKIVIAPSNWFRGVKTKDLGICPDEWFLL